jgi:hypothetical protein
MAVVRSCEVGAKVASLNVGSEVVYVDKSAESVQLLLRFGGGLSSCFDTMVLTEERLGTWSLKFVTKVSVPTSISSCFKTYAM